MPEKKPYYSIDPEIFLQCWYDSLEKSHTIQQMVEELQERCDADPKNAKAVANGDGKTLTVSQIDSKMNYYRKSYELKISKPKNLLTKAKRQIRKEKFQAMFIDKGHVEK